MTAVWVVRDKDGRFCYAYPSSIEAMDAADSDDTVTEENLLTPAHAAVVEAAVASFHDTQTSAYELERALEKAVAILRKQEAEL